MIALLFKMAIGHALGDFALQSDFMAKFKSRKSESEMWMHVLLAHSLIHGGAVYIATGNEYLGIAETICHALIDHSKCEGWIGFHTDQWLHIVCKGCWAIIATATRSSI